MTRLESIRTHIRVALPVGSVRARLAKNAFWTLSGGIAAQGLAAVSSMILARVFGETTYGELGIIRSTVGMFDLMAGLGLGLTANRHMAQLRNSDPDRAGRILGLSMMIAIFSGVAMAVTVFVGADVIASRTLANPSLARYLRIAALLLLLGSLAGVQNGALAGLESFKKISIWQTTNALLGSVFVLTGGILGGLEGAVWACLISPALGFVVNRWLLLSDCRASGIIIRYRGAWQERRVLWTFALPTFLSGMMVTPVCWMASAILVNTPNGYAEMGVFSAANQWRSFLLFLPGIVAAPLLPILVQLYANGEYRRLNSVLHKCLLGNMALVGSVAALLALLAPYIMSLYGPGFRSGVPAFLCVLLVSVLLAGGMVVGNLITSIGTMWVAFMLNSLWGALLLCTAFLLRSHGATGLAMAYAIAYAVHTVAQLAYARWQSRKHAVVSTLAHTRSQVDHPPRLVNSAMMGGQE